MAKIFNIVEPLREFLVPIDDLNPDPVNARVHNDENVEAIKKSLEALGQHRPAVVQKTGMVIRVGNGMVSAAKLLGWTHVAALIVDESNVDAIARAIADNKIGELASWDHPALDNLMRGLEGDGFEVSALGFGDLELEIMLGHGEDIAPPPLIDYDAKLQESGDSDAKKTAAEMKTEGYDTSTVRQIVLPMNEAEYAEIMVMVDFLERRWGCANNTETILAAIRRTNETESALDHSEA